MERNALCQANDDILQARKLVALARTGSPHVRDLPPVAIAHGNLLGDVCFDNIFSDMQFHGKIKQSAFEVQTCAEVLDIDLQAATHRHMEISCDTNLKSAVLREARARLQTAREAVFDKLGGQYGTSPLVGNLGPLTGRLPTHSAVA